MWRHTDNGTVDAAGSFAYTVGPWIGFRPALVETASIHGRMPSFCFACLAPLTVARGCGAPYETNKLCLIVKLKDCLHATSCQSEFAGPADSVFVVLTPSVAADGGA